VNIAGSRLEHPTDPNPCLAGWWRPGPGTGTHLTKPQFMQQSAPLRLGGSGNLTELKLALPSDATFLPDRIVRPSSTPKNAPPTYASYASNWSTVVCAPTTSVASKPPNEKQKMDAMDEELIASAAEPQETRKPKRIQPIHTGPIPSVSTPTVFSTAPFWTKSADLKPNRTRPVQRTVELVCLFQAYKMYMPIFNESD